MEHGDAVRVAPTDAEVERAIASVPGVVHAAVTRSDDAERSRLRIRLAPGEDPEGIAWAVAATLRERFGIALDPDAIRPAMTEHAEPTPAAETNDPVRLVHAPVAAAEPASASVPPAEGGLIETRQRLTAALGAITAVEDAPTDATDGRDEATAPVAPEPPIVAPEPPIVAPEPPIVAPEPPIVAPEPPIVAPEPEPAPVASAPAPVAETAATPRPTIRTLDTQRDASDIRVVASLEHRGRVAQGDAIGLATQAGSLRAVAEATVAALRKLAHGELHIGVDHVSLQPAGDPATASVVVTLLTERGEERLVGASLLREDPERAVMRATLDALNRRVTPYLEAPEADGAA